MRRSRPGIQTSPPAPLLQIFSCGFASVNRTLFYVIRYPLRAGDVSGLHIGILIRYIASSTGSVSPRIPTVSWRLRLCSRNIQTNAIDAHDEPPLEPANCSSWHTPYPIYRPGTRKTLASSSLCPLVYQNLMANPTVANKLFCRPNTSVSRPTPPELKSRISPRRLTWGSIFKSSPPPISNAADPLALVPPVKSCWLKRP